MNYSIDFSKVTLDHYKDELKRRDFIPSRLILKEQAEIHFNAFKKAKITTLDQLFSRINGRETKAKLLMDKNVSENYLTVLLRELKSIQPKPVKLKEFTWISNKSIIKMEKAGISNTKLVYERLGKASDRKKFTIETGIEEPDIIELLKLSDLVRIQWVNSTFARVLFASGFDTVKKVSMADCEDLYNKVSLKNQELKLYKGKIGLNDMKLCIEAAKSIPAEIEI